MKLFCDLVVGIASFASRAERPGPLSSETNVSIKSKTIQFQSFPDAHHGGDGASWLSGLHLARQTNVVDASHLYITVFRCRSCSGTLPHHFRSTFSKLCSWFLIKPALIFFAYVTEIPATANQQQTLLFHPENKKLESVQHCKNKMIEVLATRNNVRVRNFY